MRVTVINAVYDILNDLNLFKNIYKMPTNIEKERSFPVAWINLKGETFNPDALNTTSNFRNASLDITIGEKNDRGEDNLNSVIDTVYSTIVDNYTLNGAIINLSPLDIVTDEGYLFPYALASLNFRLMYK